jgi:hypothetical protein
MSTSIPRAVTASASRTAAARGWTASSKLATIAVQNVADGSSVTWVRTAVDADAPSGGVGVPPESVGVPPESAGVPPEGAGAVPDTDTSGEKGSRPAKVGAARGVRSDTGKSPAPPDGVGATAGRTDRVVPGEAWELVRHPGRKRTCSPAIEAMAATPIAQRHRLVEARPGVTRTLLAISLDTSVDLRGSFIPDREYVFGPHRPRPVEVSRITRPLRDREPQMIPRG